LANSQIKFTQGANNPPAGQAIQAVTGVALVITNGDNTNVVTWLYQVIDVPPGSAIPIGTLSTTATAGFTPDVTGGYQIKLTTTDNVANTYVDFRAALIPEDSVYSRIIAPFSAASDALNISAQTRGWAPFMESYLHVIDRLRDVGPTAPTDKQLLMWKTSANRYEAGVPTGVGDWSGTMYANRVTHIQTVPINDLSATPPLVGDLLSFDGTKFVAIPSTNVGNWIIYQQGGVSAGNKVATWAEVMALFAQTSGLVTIDVDATLVAGTATIPAGLYAFEDRVTITGAPAFSTILSLDNGVQLQDVSRIVSIGVTCNNAIVPSLVYLVGVGTFVTDGAVITTAGAAPVVTVGPGGFAFIEFLNEAGCECAVGPLVHLNDATAGFNLFVFECQTPFFTKNGVITGVAGSTLGLIYDSTWPIPEPTNPGFAGTVTRTQTTTALTQLTATRRVQFLANATLGTSTLMPANTGDLVTHIHDAATNPTANPTSGAILWSQSGVLHVRQSDGTTFALSADVTPPTGTGLVHATSGAFDAAAYLGTTTQIPIVNAGGTDTAWCTVSGDGTLGSTGVLAVTKVAGITISGTPAIGNQPVATSTSAAAWASLNLAGGSNYVTGVLPIANVGFGTAAQILQTNAGATAAVWTTMSGDGTIGATGVLAVTKVAGITISGTPAIGNQPVATSTSAAAWASLNLAGGANFVTGLLPLANIGIGTAGQFPVTNAGATALVAVSMSDNATMTSTGAVTVVKINGASVTSAGALTIGNTLHVSGTSALQYGALNLAGGVDYVTGLLPIGNLGFGTAAQILQTNAGATAAVWTTVSGDGTIGATGVLAITKVNGVTITGTPAANYVPVATSSSSATWGVIPLASITPGTAAQVLTTNAGATAGAWVTTSGDLTNTAAGAYTVVALGTSNATVNVATTALTFGAIPAAAGNIRLSNNTTILAARNAANSADISLVNSSAANAVQFGDVTNSSTTSLRGFSQVDMSLGFANVSLVLDGSGITAKTGAYILNDSAANIESLRLTLANAGTTSITFGAGVTAANIIQTTQASDIATHAMTIKGQYAFATATGTNRKAGSVIVDVGPPTNGLTGTASEATFGVTRNGSRVANLGQSDDVAWNCLWLGPDPAAASSSATAALQSDGSSFTYLSDQTAVGLKVNTVLYVYCSGSAVRFFGSGVTGLGGSTGTLSIADTGTPPTSSPTGGGLIYSVSGAGTWKGTSGTVTTFGAADLPGFMETAGNGHCPSCGTDFAHDWHNDKYGSLTVCMNCLTEEIGERDWIVRKKAA
jgi:hypothetical protein